MDSYVLGGATAVIVAALWSANSILFTEAGKRIGALGVNVYRTTIAVVLLAVSHVIFFGTIVPQANQAQWFWIGVSGIVGLGIGDLALFYSFVVIGPRISLLLMSLAPICSAISGFFILDEVLGIWVIIGISVTLLGIFIVILDREEQPETRALTRSQKNYGIFLGVVAAVGQGVGLVLSKYGMITVADDPTMPLDSLSVTFIRMLVAGIFIWIYAFSTGKFSELKHALKDKRAMTLTSGGAFIGPFLGVWLSMVAVSLIEAGIAQTLMSLMPVMIIPIMWVLYKQKTSWRGIAGAIIAVMGVAILFLI